MHLLWSYSTQVRAHFVDYYTELARHHFLAIDANKFQVPASVMFGVKRGILREADNSVCASGDTPAHCILQAE